MAGRRGDAGGAPVRRRRAGPGHPHQRTPRPSGRRGLAVGAIDETIQVKQGDRTAAVKRHYLGCAGKVANGIITVHLAYAREGTGHALIAARQRIPREHLDDPVKRQVIGLLPGLAFRTTGQLGAAGRQKRRIPRFAKLWHDGAVGGHAEDRKTIRHPGIGEITVDCDVLNDSDTDLKMVIYRRVGQRGRNQA